jgi:hypothetical protein
MRIVQFRRHLATFVVRVTDTRDITVLQAHKDFTPLMVVKHILKSGRKTCYNTISAEFMFQAPDDVTLAAWKKKVWAILKYRNYKVK